MLNINDTQCIRLQMIRNQTCLLLCATPMTDQMAGPIWDKFEVCSERFCYVGHW